MISQPTPKTRIEDDLGYNSLHVVHCMTHSMSHSVAVKHHHDSDVVEAMQPRESKLRCPLSQLN